MSVLMRVVWALVVAAAVSGGVYWLMNRDGRSGDDFLRRDKIARQVDQAADKARSAVDAVKNVADQVGDVGTAARKAKELITTIPNAYRHVTDVLSGDTVPSIPSQTPSSSGNGAGSGSGSTN